MSRSIKLLGSVSIAENGRSSLLRKNVKGCALLTYLIVTQKPQSREHIADLLWEARTTAQSLRNLRVLLSRIRPLLPELHISRKEIAYHPEPETEIDFLSLSNALAAPEDDRLAAAMPLYEGALLADFHIEDAPRFNEWLLLERERLQHRVIEAHHHLCEAFAEQRNWPAGVEAAKRWLVHDDLDERAWRWQIEFLAAMGQQTTALQQYETCRQRLWQELGVEPEAATTALAQQVESMRKTAVLPPTIEPPSLSDAPLNELPPPGALPPNAIVPFRRNDNFTGRTESLQAIANHLLKPVTSTPPVIAITGMGGLGKTQLAVEFCYRYGRYFPGGVFWFSFANAESVAEEIAAAGGERGMGLYRDTDQLSRADQIRQVQRAWQKTFPRLLIFDNCEEEELLAKWLPVTGSCRVLLTSRRAPWSRELQVAEWPLPMLTLAESITLLQKLAPELSPEEAGEIATELGHLSLAMHLAGGFLHRYRQISTQRYLSQLQQLGTLHHPSLTGRGIHYSPTGHELNVSRTFAINLEQLDPANKVNHIARQLLVHAACFAPGEPIPQNLLLATVVEDMQDLTAILLAEDALAQLFVLGFLETKSHEMVVMHRLLVAFTKHYFENITTAQTVAEETVLKFVSKTAVGTFALASLPFPSSHLRYMMEQALPRRDVNTARLINLWGRHVRDNGETKKAFQLLIKAQEIQLATIGPNHPETIESLRQIGNLYVRLAQFKQALPYKEQYLAVLEQAESPDFTKIARALDNLGTLHLALGTYAQARLYLERGLDIRKQCLGREHLDTSLSMLNLGVFYLWVGDYENAQHFISRALEIIRRNRGEAHPITAMALQYLGDSYLGLGNLKKAWTVAEKSLAIRTDTLGSQHAQNSFSLTTLGLIRMQESQLDAAWSLLMKALELRKKNMSEHDPAIGESMLYLGRVLLKMEKVEPAKEHLLKALAIQEKGQGQEHPKTARFLISIGELYEEMGESKHAWIYYERALALWADIDTYIHPDIQQVHRKLAFLKTSESSPSPISQ